MFRWAPYLYELLWLHESHHVSSCLILQYLIDFVCFSVPLPLVDFSIPFLCVSPPPLLWDSPSPACAFLCAPLPLLCVFLSLPPVRMFRLPPPPLYMRFGHQDTVTPEHWETLMLGHKDTETQGHWDISTIGWVVVATYRNCVVIFSEGNLTLWITLSRCVYVCLYVCNKFLRNVPQHCTSSYGALRLVLIATLNQGCQIWGVDFESSPTDTFVPSPEIFFCRLCYLFHKLTNRIKIS